MESSLASADARRRRNRRAPCAVARRTPCARCRSARGWDHELELSIPTRRIGRAVRTSVLRSDARVMRQRDANLLELLRDDIPVPSVLFVAPDGANGRPPFCVLEWIDGISLRELRRRGDDRGVADASYDAGRLLPRLMRHRFDRGGLLDSSLAVTDGPFTDASLVAVVEELTSDARFRQRVDEPLRARLHAFLRATESFHAVTGPPTLVHGDFNSPNIFVHQVGGRWSVAAILDWEFAFAGSILCDVGNMLRYERADRPRYEPHFSRGLADGGWPLPDEWFLRARLADLPALCELLARDDVPDAIVAELLDLLRGTIGVGEWSPPTA